MKKLLSLLLFLLFSFVAPNAYGVIEILGGGTPSNSCPSGTYELGYNGDHTSGADYVCYESGTANEQASANTADTVSTNYVSSDALNEHLKFTITGDISADIDSLGSVFFSWYIVDDSTFGDSPTIEINYSATEQIYVRIDGGNTRVRCDHEGGAVNNSVLTAGFSVATNYRCGYTWDAASNIHAVDCVASGAVAWTSNGGSPDDEDSEDVDGFDDGGAVDPSTFVIGEDLGPLSVNDTWRVWDVFLVPGYKATDPGSL